jgi:hypothetical protein
MLGRKGSASAFVSQRECFHSQTRQERVLPSWKIVMIQGKMKKVLKRIHSLNQLVEGGLTNKVSIKNSRDWKQKR